MALSCFVLGFAPALAHAANCVRIDEARDGLTPEERSSAITLFEDTLTQEHQPVGRDACTDTWMLNHVRLGESVTITVQSSQGTRRAKANRLEDLPNIYSQMVRSILAGGEMTNESGAVNRKNVTEAQSSKAQRVRADAIWYAKLGYGVTTADGLDSGPEFGFGRRWELDRVGIDLSFLNFLMYQNSEGFNGVSAGWVELAADYFFDADANSTPYIGAGVSLGSHSVPSSKGDFDGSGLQAKGTVGYEMFRASTIRLLVQFDALLPMYRLVRKDYDNTGTEFISHAYAPTFLLSLGLGWGSTSE
jgi:hypothetical protein